MRILVDTNVLFSALFFPNGQTAKTFAQVIQHHELVIPAYVIDELKKVVRKKHPEALPIIDAFLKNQFFDLVYTPEIIPNNLFRIRDPKDYPILYTAIIENVDVVISGDEDFKDTDVTHPEILTPAEFYNKYC